VDVVVSNGSILRLYENQNCVVPNEGAKDFVPPCGCFPISINFWRGHGVRPEEKKLENQRGKESYFRAVIWLLRGAKRKNDPRRLKILPQH
jgi:hypothetical protein